MKTCFLLRPPPELRVPRTRVRPPGRGWASPEYENSACAIGLAPFDPWGSTLRNHIGLPFIAPFTQPLAPRVPSLHAKRARPPVLLPEPCGSPSTGSGTVHSCRQIPGFLRMFKGVHRRVVRLRDPTPRSRQ